VDERSAGGAAYVQEWHHRHAGATTVIQGAMADDQGRITYRVLADAIKEGDEPVPSFGANLNPLARGQ
jgi:hypothetical protein